MFKKTIITSAAVAALLLTGCNSSEESASTADSTDITVERGPVLGALVLDNSGERGVSIGNGVYRFAKGVEYPVTVNGGYIDTDRNNQIDSGEVRLGYELAIREGRAVTLVSTVANNNEVRTMLQENYGLDDERINNATPSSDREIAAISDVLYAYCSENDLEPLKLQATDIEEIDQRIRERLRVYDEDNSSVAELEEALIVELGIETLSEEELPQAKADLENAGLQDGTLIDTLPSSELSDAQKEGLVFMVEEEKLARDVYEYLYANWDLTIFSNIAKAEQQHMDTVITLLEKYNLDYAATLQTRGSFENEELQSLYDTLTAKGEVSVLEALEVGKLIEEVDIEDLEELVTGNIPDDLKVVYENLLKGSYNHLSAFVNQLSRY
jgi:hypothetical protein